MEAGEIKMMILNLYCPKCKSKDIGIICLNPPERKYINMDDVPQRIEYYSPAIYVEKKYRATCKSCGYSKEWME